MKQVGRLGPDSHDSADAYASAPKQNTKTRHNKLPLLFGLLQPLDVQEMDWDACPATQLHLTSQAGTHGTVHDADAAQGSITYFTCISTNGYCGTVCVWDAMRSAPACEQRQS